jgi:hypothetical protein
LTVKLCSENVCTSAATELPSILGPEIVLDPHLVGMGQHDALHRRKLLVELQLPTAIAAIVDGESTSTTTTGSVKKVLLLGGPLRMTMSGLNLWRPVELALACTMSNLISRSHWSPAGALARSVASWGFMNPGMSGDLIRAIYSTQQNATLSRRLPAALGGCGGHGGEVSGEETSEFQCPDLEYFPVSDVSDNRRTQWYQYLVLAALPRFANEIPCALAAF